MFSDIADADDFDSWLSRNQEQRTKKAPFAVKPQPAAESTENETAKAPNDESLKTGIGTQSISSLSSSGFDNDSVIQSTEDSVEQETPVHEASSPESHEEREEDGETRWPSKDATASNESFTVVQAHKREEAGIIQLKSYMESLIKWKKTVTWRITTHNRRPLHLKTLLHQATMKMTIRKVC